MLSDARALIGATGFVGSTLRSQTGFDELYHSRNIGEIRGRSFDFVVCAAARAEKWKANAEPQQDRAHVEALMADLGTIDAKRFVLISTVDVYPRPMQVDEDTRIDPPSPQAYGTHRLLLEKFIRERFPGACIIRLPGLFGAGLKKNMIYDLLHDNTACLDGMHPDSTFQFYDMSNLWRDMDLILARDIPLVNLAVEPVRAADVARQCFEREFTKTPAKPPVAYDMRSKFAKPLAGREWYFYSAAESLQGIRALRAAHLAQPVA